MHETTTEAAWVVVVLVAIGLIGMFLIGKFSERSNAALALRDKIKAEASYLRDLYLNGLKTILDQMIADFLRKMEPPELPMEYYRIKIEASFKTSEMAASFGDYKVFIREARRIMDTIFRDVSDDVFREKIHEFYVLLEDAFEEIEDGDLPETITGLASFSKAVGERDAERKVFFETLSKKETPSM